LLLSLIYNKLFEDDPAGRGAGMPTRPSTVSGDPGNDAVSYGFAVTLIAGRRPGVSKSLISLSTHLHNFLEQKDLWTFTFVRLAKKLFT
jgi:hypothetical protein